LQNPVLKYESGRTEETAQNDILGEFKYDGLMLNDTNVLLNLDKTLDTEKGKSLVYPVSTTAKGDIGKTVLNKAYKSEEIDLLLAKNEKNYREAATEVFSGNVELNPIRKGKQLVSCAYCPFKSVCFFDPKMKDNFYRKDRDFKTSREEIFSNLQNEFGESSNTEGEK
jgi:ATP-dependent helicase/nuclease subunit B